MGGKGRHHLLGVWSPDPTLSLLAAIGLGAAAGTAVVIDLSVGTRPVGRSLADIAGDGPNLDELSPGRRGVAFLPGGPVTADQSIELVRRLARRWPSVVLRLDGPKIPVATVPVAPLVAGRLVAPPRMKHAVWQPVGTSIDPPGPGPVLPRLRGGLVRHLLEGRVPERSRWVRAFGPVWEMPWE